MNQDIIVRVETGAPVSDFAVQSVPVTTQVTPTTAPVFVDAPRTVPLPGPEGSVLDDWMANPSSREAQLFLSRLDAEITLVHTAVEIGQMTAIRLGPDEVSVVGLRCGGASGSGFVSGEFPDQLVFSLSGSTCIVPRDGSAAPSLLENAQLSFPIAETASTGWFCDDSDRQPRVAAYQVGGSLGTWVDAPACPYLAEPNYLVPPGALAVGTASPSGRYLFLQWLDPTARSSGLSGRAVFDLESPLRARPVAGTSGLVQTTWTSDEQLVMLITPRGFGCEECGSAIHLWDWATGQSELLLPIPTEFGEFSLRLIAS